MSIQTSTLKNGLRVVTDRVTTVETVALGVWANVGTRHEKLAENGVAHMVEHMLFKGTPSMNAQRIAEVIEDVGGNMNAYTAREMTAYYVHLLQEDLDLALGVLADIIQNSTMPEDEVERERGVILQEIKMYADQPDSLIFDNFQQAAYPNQALGASGLGTSEIIAAMSRDALIKYVAQNYSPKNLVISVAGPVDHDTLVKKVEALFSHLPEGSKDDFAPAHYNPILSLQEKATEQSHIVLGFKGIRRDHPQYSAMRLLSAILGGGMSSRLFQEVREKRGLVYSIYSFHDAFRDDGLFGIYAGTGPEHLAELMPVVIDEIKSMTGEIKDAELKRVKAQIKAGILMSREKIMTRADQQARHMIHFDKPFDVKTMVDKIDAVTARDVSDMAGLVFASTPTLAAIGPLGDLMSFDQIKERLPA